MLDSQYLAHKTVFYKRLPRVCFAWQHVGGEPLQHVVNVANAGVTRRQLWGRWTFRANKEKLCEGGRAPCWRGGAAPTPSCPPPSLVLPPILADLGLLILLLAPLQTLLGVGWSRIWPTSVKMGTRSIFRNVALSSRPFGLLCGIRITLSGIRITVK